MSEPIVSITGSRERPKCVKLTTTAATTIMNGPASGFITVESLRYSCGTSGSTLSIWVTDGTTDYYLMQTEAVAANTSDILTDHIVLISGWSIKAQAADANRVDIILVPVLSGQSGTSSQ